MSLKVSVVVGLVALAWSGVAFADVVSDEMVSCNGKNDDDACVLPGGGSGVCVRLRDERRNRTFLTCATSRAQFPDALPAPSAKPDAPKPQADVVVPTSKPSTTPASSASSAPGKSSGCAVSAPGAGGSPVTVAALIACWTAWLVARARWRAHRAAAASRMV